MTLTALERLEGDGDDLVAKFQWIGHMFLKSVTILRYSEPTIASKARAAQEKKGLEEKLAIFQNEKLALEDAKQNYFLMSMS